MIDAMRDALFGYGDTGIVVWTVLKILAIAVPVIIAVAMFVYWERKVIGWMHVRMGPNQIGPFGLLQAFADVGWMRERLIAGLGLPAGATPSSFIAAISRSTSS